MPLPAAEVVPGEVVELQEDVLGHGFRRPAARAEERPIVPDLRDDVDLHLGLRALVPSPPPPSGPEGDRRLLQPSAVPKVFRADPHEDGCHEFFERPLHALQVGFRPHVGDAVGVHQDEPEPKPEHVVRDAPAGLTGDPRAQRRLLPDDVQQLQGGERLDDGRRRPLRLSGDVG